MLYRQLPKYISAKSCFLPSKQILRKVEDYKQLAFKASNIGRLKALWDQKHILLSTFRRHFNIFKNRNSVISCLHCYPLNNISDENGFKSLVGTCCNLCFMTRHFLTSFLISLSYILSQQQSMISIWWQSALSVVHVYVEKTLIIVCLTNISSFENVTVICPSSPVFIPLKLSMISE